MDTAANTPADPSPSVTSGRVAARRERGFARWREGKLSEATTELEAALAEAREPPYELPLGERLQLAMQLADLHLGADATERARELLAEEANFAEELFQMIQLTGTPDQKRATHGAYIQIRDRAAQVALLGHEAPRFRSRSG